MLYKIHMLCRSIMYKLQEIAIHSCKAEALKQSVHNLRTQIGYVIHVTLCGHGQEYLIVYYTCIVVL